MIKNPKIPVKADPQGLDIALDRIAEALKVELSWLNNAYGKVETLIEGFTYDNISTPASRRLQKRFPAIYIGGKRDKGYLNLLPDGHLGNYSYAEVLVEKIDHIRRQSPIRKPRVSFTFWFDYRKIYTDHRARSIENVKSEVFAALDKIQVSGCSIMVLEFQEGAENIYKGYNHEEVREQFLMRPYGGFKIVTDLVIKQTC